jgi:predicted Zn-dependent peptidase
MTGRRIAGIPAACVVLALCGGAIATTPAPPSDPYALTYPPLRLQFPAPTTTTLKNGLVVHLLPDTELPIVDLAFYAGGGSIYDPEDKAGLAALALHAMRTGGTESLTPDQVDQKLETLPATIDFDAGDDALSGTLSCLKDRFPEALGILAAMLRSPRFDAARLEIERGRALEQIRRRWDDPGETSSLVFERLVYGEHSPWARLETTDTVARIGRDDLIAWQKSFLRPANLRVAVSGDFEPKKMIRLLEETFGGWEAGRTDLPKIPKVEDHVEPGVYLIERPMSQSALALGHLGVNRFDPDRFPLFIVNEVLGEGGFTSRLMKEVRSARGLAYSVGGGVGSGTDRGLFEIRCRTRADATVQAIQAIRDVVAGVRDQGPTEEEMKLAKDSEVNAFVFTVDGTSAFMDQFLFYEHYGYPPDYLQAWRGKLSAVTLQQAAAAAKRWLHPDRMVVLVVGNPKAFDKPLQDLGLGEPRRITLPDGGGLPVVAAATSATPGASAQPGAAPGSRGAPGSSAPPH